ncbi:MAG: hypothetical protein R3F53_13120 [Gammaproteobacteria bacterium]
MTVVVRPIERTSKFYLAGLYLLENLVDRPSLQVTMAKQRAEQERLRRLRTARGLVYIKGWVSPQQAEAILAIMSNNAISYQPIDEAELAASPAQADLHSNETAVKRPRLRFEKKIDHPGAWTVWVGRIELGTIYKHVIDENPRPVTVWMAYQHGQRSTRHETRQLAAAALLKAYHGPL